MATVGSVLGAGNLAVEKTVMAWFVPFTFCTFSWQLAIRCFTALTPAQLAAVEVCEQGRGADPGTEHRCVVV